MAMNANRPPARSGCALVLGVFLIVLGALLLVQNLFEVSLDWLWARGIYWLTLYWPILLIVWGSLKLYGRLTRPESSRVGAGELVAVVLVVVLGLGLGQARRVIEGSSSELSLEDVFAVLERDRGPAHRFPAAEQRLTLGAATHLQLDHRGGSVWVSGWDEDELKVEMVKVVYERSEARAKEIARDLQLRFTGGAEAGARLSVEGPASARARYETELAVWIPRNRSLTVSSRRGPVRVSGLAAALAVTTAHDAIEIESIRGPVRVEGRHGPVRIEGIEGDVEARSRYGPLTVEDVRGDVVALTANGRLLVSQVTGAARLENRHARVEAREVGGDLAIVAPHSDVSVQDARASVAIESSYGPVFVMRARGPVRVAARSSDVETRSVEGDVRIDNVHRPVTAVDIGGAVQIRSSHGPIHLDRVRGAVEIESSHRPVQIREFGSALSVRSEHAPLEVVTSALGGEVDLATSYGDVRLVLPSDARFRLRATARLGAIDSSFRGPGWDETKRGEEQILQGGTDAAAPLVVISARYGNIEIRRRDDP